MLADVSMFGGEVIVLDSPSGIIDLEKVSQQLRVYPL